MTELQEAVFTAQRNYDVTVALRGEDCPAADRLWEKFREAIEKLAQEEA